MISGSDLKLGPRNNFWYRMSIFRSNRKPSQQNVLNRIELQSEATDGSEEEKSSKTFSYLIDKIKSSGKILKNFELLCCLMAFALSISISYVLLMTSWYEDQILKALVLTNNSITYNYWKEPPIKPVVSIYIFNYTNAEEALAGKEKPRVEQVGPYTFIETMERVNVKFYPNGTVSFQEKRSHEFIRNLSANLEDVIVTPNLPLIIALDYGRSSYIIGRIGLTVLFKTLNMTPFHKMSANEFIWGSNDRLSSFTSKAAHFLNKEIPSGFGILSSRIGVSPDVVTIFNGMNDLEKFGIIDRFNGQKKINIWESDCDRLDASDGTLYSPRLLGSGQTVYVYAKEFCRRMPLNFEKNVKTDDGFPALRYKNPENIFSPPKINPNNSCFCVNTECTPDGLQNTGPCSFGAPFYLSMPHLLRADSSVRKAMLGLTPDTEKHSSYIDIHEKLGIPIAGVSRLQMNIRIEKSDMFSIFDGLEDGIFLPIGWIQCEIGQLPPDLRRIIFHITFSAKFFEYFLNTLSIILTLTSVYMVKKKMDSIKEEYSLE